MKRPDRMPGLAVQCLQALAAAGLGEKLSLGGALGLLHYHDYRETHDADAWWQDTTSPADRDQVVQVIRSVLARVGEVRLRTWGDVVSIELLEGRKKAFSFQIAARSALLEQPHPAPWVPVLLDSFADLVANKMTALVERGAPRDFRDIHAVCQAGLTTPAECWRLWRLRQQAARCSTDPARARLAVETHLARIETQRPLETISDPAARAQAHAARHWIDFLARLCAAWDFGILPEQETIHEILRPEWTPAVEACRLLTSPTYHLVRRWHGLSVQPYLGQEIPAILEDPSLAHT